MKFISRRSFIIGGGLTLLSYLYFEVHSIAVKKYSIAMPNLPLSLNGFTILHLSDLHSKEYGKRQGKLLDLINQYTYDIVAVTGDLIDKGNPDIKPGLELIQGLTKPTYFVPGNHDWWTGFKFREQLLHLGVLTCFSLVIPMEGRCGYPLLEH